MNESVSLLLLIPHLGGGGAERVTELLARNLDPGHFEIHLATVTGQFPSGSALPDHVHYHPLHAGRVQNSAVPLLRLIWKLKPRVILSNMAHLNFLLLLLKPLLPMGIRILIRQNTTASAAAGSFVMQTCYRILYPMADRILCQSQAMADDMELHFGIPGTKLTVLANPIDTEAMTARLRTLGTRDPMPEYPRPENPWRKDPWQENRWPRIVSVGRLSKEKGVDLLLETLPGLVSRFPKLLCSILGSGPEEGALREMVRRTGLENCVHFAGYQSDPMAFLVDADLFVLPSRYEGMPNALLEAASAGLPLVATPCCGGVVRLLQSVPGAWLSSEISSTAIEASVLRALTSLPHPRARFEHRFLEPNRLPNAIAAYATILTQVAGYNRS